jgi:excisionase family DNA binding protein
VTLEDAPDVLTVEEASRIARVGRNAMYMAVQRGDVFSRRIGKSIRIPKRALVDFLNGPTGAPNAAKEAPAATTATSALEVERVSAHTPTPQS